MVELTGDVDKDPNTPEKDIKYFVRVLTVFALCQAPLVTIVVLFKGLHPSTASCVVSWSRSKTVSGSIRQGISRWISVICTDKTGTLTMNLMSVANLWSFGSKNTTEEFSSQLQSLMEVATLNSRVGVPNVLFQKCDRYLKLGGSLAPIDDRFFVDLVTLQDPPRAEVLAERRTTSREKVKEDDIKAVVVHGSSIPDM
eukprot:gene6673-8487_t